MVQWVKNLTAGVPTMAQQKRTQLVSMRMQVLIPGAAQCLKDPSLLQVVVQAQIWCGCGCDVGWQLQL